MAKHIDATKFVKSPQDPVSITWEVDQYSGSTQCPAWAAQHEIESLEKAGYTVLDVTAFR